MNTHDNEFNLFDQYNKTTKMSRFKIVKELGSGAFADVFEADDTVLTRRVAIKIVREANLEVSNALAHARALARLYAVSCGN